MFSIVNIYNFITNSYFLPVPILRNGLMLNVATVKSIPLFELYLTELN